MQIRSSNLKCSIKKGFLKTFPIFTGKHLCWSLFLKKPAILLKRDPAQVFSCEFCEIFKNTYFGKSLRTAASGKLHIPKLPKMNKHNSVKILYKIAILKDLIFLRKKQFQATQT